MSGSVVKQCECVHPFQDKVYGNKQRLFNINLKKDKAKCTVCGAIKVVGK